MEEAGYADFVFAADCLLLAPARVPPEKVAWLERETLKVLDTPQMKDKLFKAGFQVQAAGARDTWARVTKEIAFFKGIIEKAGIPRL
jgi:tripartite-type tricarboxylate transporter receptor subunit TctC